MLRIAVQKSGRLQVESLGLLTKCGFTVDTSFGKLKCSVPDFPLEILFLRNSDIPAYVEDGVVDCGIVGNNLLTELQSDLKIVIPLSFSKCRVSLAIPRSSEITTINGLNGKKIATSYPITTRTFLMQNGIQAEIHKISGSVEIAPNIGLADAIVDVVSTGNTLFMNGLKELTTLMNSEAVLIKSNSMTSDREAILEQLVFRIKSVLSAKKSKYILLNAPNEKIEAISQILPGMKSPTLLPLAQDGWSSVHSVISENMFWENINALKTAGAEGILVIPIEKMIL